MTCHQARARELCVRLTEASADRALAIGDAWNLLEEAGHELRAALAEIKRLRAARHCENRDHGFPHCDDLARAIGQPPSIDVAETQRFGGRQTARQERPYDNDGEIY